MDRDLKDIIKGIFWAIIICTIISLCTSCKTRYIAVPEVHTEYISKTDTFLNRDSIYLHDSIYCALKGDTMYIERFNTKYIERMKYTYKTDTICKTDSVAVPYEVTKYRTPRFNWVVMGIELFLLLLLAVFVYIRKRL